jgi:hypothetical protein
MRETNARDDCEMIEKDDCEKWMREMIAMKDDCSR